MSVFDNDENENKPIDIFAQVSLEDTQDDFVYKEIQESAVIDETSVAVDEESDDFHKQFVDTALSVLDDNTPNDTRKKLEVDGDEIYREITNNFVKMMNGEIPPKAVATESRAEITDESFREMVQESVTENQVNDLITDTPSNPSEEPPVGEEDAERYISLEEDPEMEKTSNELDSLMDIHTELVALGGISQTQVASIEALYPGLIPNGSKPQYFSSRTSPTGYNVSVESLARRIVETIIKFLKGMVERMKNLGKRIRSFVPEHTLSENASAWDDVLSKAKKADANNGAVRLKAMKSKDPIAAKSGNVVHYMKMYCNEQLGKQSGNWCVGLESIMQGGDISDDLSKLNRSTLTAIDDVKSNIARYNDGNYSFKTIEDIIGDPETYLSKLKHSLDAPTRIRDVSFEKMISVDTNTFDKTIGVANGLIKTIGQIENTIERLAKTTREDNVEKKVTAVKDLNEQTIILNKYVSAMDIYLRVYGRYIKMQRYILRLAHVQAAMFGVIIN